MTVAGWKAWYTSGRVYRSSILTWEDLPRDGLLLLCVFYKERSPHGLPLKSILRSQKYYFKTEDGDIQFSGTPPNTAYYISGTTNDDAIKLIQKEALECRRG